MAVNVLGCLVIGFLATLAERRGFLTPEFRLFWMTGLLGAFTTFSALIYESGQLIHQGQSNLAALNVFGSLAAGFLAYLAGSWLAALF
jgi:CrcB protein